MVDVTKHAEKSISGGIAGAIFRFFIRFMQFVLALAVVGLYGTDVNKSRMEGQSSDPNWVYAVTVGGMAALTSVVYTIPLVKSYLFFVWDALLCLLWLVVFGIFGKMYISQDPKGNHDMIRMKHAVWVDLINLLMWVTTAIYGGVLFKRYRGIPSSSAARSEV